MLRESLVCVGNRSITLCFQALFGGSGVTA